MNSVNYIEILFFRSSFSCNKMFRVGLQIVDTEVCKVERFQVTVNKIQYIYHLFMLISDDFWLKVLNIAKRVP